MAEEKEVTEKQQAELDRVGKLVEEYLQAEGLDLKDVRVETKTGFPAWAFTQGSALVQVHLRPGGQAADVTYFQVVAPVVKVPEDSREALFEYLLKLNGDELWSCAFALRDDTVLVTADRTTEDLDLSEVVELVESVAAYADRFDDELAEKFGAVRYSDTLRRSE